MAAGSRWSTGDRFIGPDVTIGTDTVIQPGVTSKGRPGLARSA